MKMAAVVALGILLGGLTYIGGTTSTTVDARALVDAGAARAVNAASCANLTSLKLPHTTITSAQVVAAGQFKAPENVRANFADLPAFCRVSMTIAPTSDSDIKSETWLPVSGWNGKFQEVGNGGWNGVHSIRRAGRRAAQGICHRVYRHGARGRHGELCHGSSREADRFRLSGRA